VGELEHYGRVRGMFEKADEGKKEVNGAGRPKSSGKGKQRVVDRKGKGKAIESEDEDTFEVKGKGKAVDMGFRDEDDDDGLY
jgi:hypothetical protein